LDIYRADSLTKTASG